MRRSPFVITATAAGLVGVLTYHTQGHAFGALGTAAAPVGVTGHAHARSAHPAAGSRAGAGASAAGGSSSAASAGGSGTSGSTQGTATSAGPPLAPGVSAPTRQVTGPLIAYGYGQLAVKVAVSGQKITAVSVTGLQTAEQYSQSLAEQVLPTLRAEVLQAQTAHIQLVSGATYTSEAFATSLQHALSQAGV
jgi:hypothetical protein